MADWLTPAAVAEYLNDASIADDPRLASVTAGIAAEVERVRSDLFAAPLEGWTVPPNVLLGATMWAAHVFQMRAAPSGFLGYGEGVGDGMADLSMASNRADIWRLIGVKRPIAL